jgi:hypothetical protein
VARIKREKWDQAKNRRTSIFKDQHGREWAAVKDVYTDAPIGPLSPYGWTPVQYKGRDLVPDNSVMVFDDARSGVFTIDYAKWRQAIEGALAMWTQTAGSYAASMYGDKAMDALNDPPPALLNILGPKPMPLDLIDAQAEGNRWILGFDVPKPKWAEEYFTEAAVVPGVKRFADADDEPKPKVKNDPKTGRFKSAEEE